MPTSGASSTPRPDLNLLDERRSAHASIRGYLYQTCLGVLRWLDLKPDEILLCEGDEDLDRFLLDGTAVSEQVKAYIGGLSITDRVARNSLRNFLRSYVTLRQRGENRKFVFTTTAYEKKKQATDLNFGLLEKWQAGVRTKRVIKSVRSLVKPNKKDKQQNEIEEALAWLDGQDGGWIGFMDSVEWTFNAPELDTLRGQIEQKLMADRTGAAPAQLLDRLIVYTLRSSSRGEVKERILTRKILDVQIGTFLADLARWAGSPEGLRIRTVFDEIDRLRDLLDEGTRDLPAKPTPGQILTAAYEVILFDEAGRRKELDFLASWCASKDRRRILLLTGEGGSGKTRLMLEWCRRLRHQGWHAGLLMRNREKEQILPLLKGTAPRLVVIDYAETRLGIVEPLLVELGQAPQREGPKLRIVLLARREADWWKNLVQLTGDVESLLVDSKPRKISALIPQDLGERQQAFQAAAAGFSGVLARKIPKDLNAPDLSGYSFERVLYLHMAAYLALYGERIETAEDALRQTLSHERRFWGQQDRHLKEALESAVAAVTLVGGVATSQQAKALLDRVLPPFSLELHEIRTLQNFLQDLYRGSAERFLDPLQPDLLGEELIMEVLHRDGGLLERLLEGGSSEESSSILTVLTRLAQRRPDQRPWIPKALHGRLEQLAEVALEVAINTGDPIGIELAGEIAVSGSTDLVRRIQARCYEDRYSSSVPLREVAWTATEKSLDLLRDRRADLNEDERIEYARLVNNLGNKLIDLGRREKALQATQEAVEIYRQLAEQRSDAFRPHVAISLSNLGNRLRDLGRREEALQAMQEAIDIYRQLAQQRPVAFRSDLAASLNRLGLILRDLGRREAALQTIQEAVEIYRQLALQRPDAFRPGLAASLNNLSLMFRDLGRREVVLKATQEAIEIYRQLAQQRPDTFRSDLAASLNNLGGMLSEFGRHEEALQAIQEAVEIRRQLAQQRPDAFRPNLATSLTNLGNILRDLGRREEALKATQSAVEIRRQLAQQHPDAFRPDLAMSINNLGLVLRDLGRREEALKATQGAVEIYRQLAQQHPDAFRSDFAMSLTNLGGMLSEFGRREEALQATQEAVEIRRQLAQQEPDAFQPDLATSLNNLGSDLSELGRHREALSVAEEAVQTLCPYFLRFPAVFAASMATMVSNYLERAEAAGAEPDQQFLAPILEVLNPSRNRCQRPLQGSVHK